jgi:hypothetical protein
MVGSSSPGGVMPRKKLSLRLLTDTDPQFMSMEEVLMRKVRGPAGFGDTTSTHHRKHDAQ